MSKTSILIQGVHTYIARLRVGPCISGIFDVLAHLWLSFTLLSPDSCHHSLVFYLYIYFTSSCDTMNNE